MPTIKWLNVDSGTPVPDMSTFKKPHTYATVTFGGRNETFKTHSSLGLVKTALTSSIWQITNYSTAEAVARHAAWVYEFVDGEWALIWEIKKNDLKSNHPLWSQYMIPEYP